MNFREYTISSYQKHFQPKMYQKVFDGHLARTPGELTVLPRPHSWIKGSPLLREGDGEEMEGEGRE